MTANFDILLSVNPTMAFSLGSIDLLTLIIVCSLILLLIPIFLPTMPGVKCPNCLSHGKIRWVLPGKNCPTCGYPC